MARSNQDNIFRLVDLTSGQLKEFRKYQDTSTGDYPSSWFNKNKTKPIIHVHKTDLDTARAAVRSMVDGGPIKVEVLVSYLFTASKQIEDQLIEDWKSYGQVIGLAGSKITPTSLLQVEELGELAIDTAGVECRQENDRWLIMYALSYYRIERATDPTYRSRIIRLITDMIKANGGPDGVNIITGFTKFKSFTSHPGYRTLVAMYDMYFFHFPNNPWACVRISTTGARYRDCAAFCSVLYTAKLLNLQHETILWTWFTCPTLNKEMDRIFHSDESYEDPYSYFPYQVDMGLVPRSLYSSRENPAVHTLCHLVGLYFSNKRSYNARFILECDVDRVVFNAHLIGFAFRRRSTRAYTGDPTNFQREWERVAAARVQESNTKEDGTELEEEDDIFDYSGVNAETTEEMSAPTSSDPIDWEPYLAYYQWNLSPEMVKFARQIQQSITEVREGTIAQFAKIAMFISRSD